MSLRNWFRRNYFSLLTFAVSIGSLIVSSLAYNTARRSLDYEISRNQLWDTPTLIDISDSTEVKYTLNKDMAQLQSVMIIFPEEIFKSDPETHSKPLSFSREYFELMAKGYIGEILHATDSTEIAGDFGIPVVIDYAAIVGSQTYLFREKRELIFDIHITTDEVSVKYNTSTLTFRPHLNTNQDIELERQKIKKQLSEELKNRYQENIIKG